MKGATSSHAEPINCQEAVFRNYFRVGDDPGVEKFSAYAAAFMSGSQQSPSNLLGSDLEMKLKA